MGIFNFLKPSSTSNLPVNLQEYDLRADMHSHLIPGIDDGAKDLESSVRMIRKLHQMGYRKLITTPHIMGDFFKNTPENINEGLVKVKEAIQEEGIEMELSAAAEYYLDEWFEEKLDGGELLTFGDNYVLVETSYLSKPANLDELLFKIKVAGYQPILAHPERYVFMFEDFNEYRSMFEKNILLQVNLLSLTGYYSPDAKYLAEKMINEGIVHFVGTDIHSMRQVPILKEAIRTDAFKKLCNLPLLNREL